VYLVTFFQQFVSQIGTILTRYTSDESDFLRHKDPLDKTESYKNISNCLLISEAPDKNRQASDFHQYFACNSV
jgi:hypothetical protein